MIRRILFNGSKNSFNAKSSSTISSKPSFKEKFKESWLNDPAVYPLIGLVGTLSMVAVSFAFYELVTKAKLKKHGNGGGRKDPLNVDPKLSLKDIDIEKKL